jgi:hypothetical protein
VKERSGGAFAPLLEAELLTTVFFHIKQIKAARVLKEQCLAAVVLYITKIAIIN